MWVIKNRKIFIGLSIVLVAVSVFLVFVEGLKLGIDFKGGALTEVSYPEGRPEMSEIRSEVQSLDFGEVLVQPTGEDGVFVKSRDLTEPERVLLIESLKGVGGGELEEKSFTSIGPSIGKELQKKSTVAIVIVGIAIILFIAYTFRKVSKPVSSWKYGGIAVITLIHDVVLTSGAFAVIGKITGAEVDTLFVVALLTVLGLSVNDTIVVFDRVRENLQNNKRDEDFKTVVGKSLDQTYGRSINTSLSTIIVLIALFFFGPESTKIFALTLAFGMFFGTYSSIFLASPLLTFSEPKKDE